MKKFLITIYILIVPIFAESHNLEHDTKPFVCDWEHINGISGWNCYNNKFYSDDNGISDDYSKGNYTSIWKMVPEDNRNKNGHPINVKSVKKTMYDKINEFRSVHKATDLYVYETLEKSAQNRANLLAAKDSKKAYPMNNKKYQESVYVANKDNLIDSVLKWYHQRYKYNFFNPEKNKYKKNVRDFVNMVWKQTYFVGCGIANHYENYFIVCHYGPKQSGKYTKNVSKASRRYDNNGNSMLE
uniref:SCP domain-containing protein n=1 Tax=Strongyloides stercoralis TaxID=6248 RepID=A0AAF5D7B0_STRER